MTRLACLAVPLFPLAARLRAEPELAETALAVLAGSGPQARVVAATRFARRAGVRAGMTLAQARALVPKLAARGRDPLCEAAAGEALLEVAESFSPRVEQAGEGVVFLDVDGVARRLRDADPERRLAELLTDATRRIALPARVGIAGSKLAARVAADAPRPPAVVPPGEEAAFLAPLPLARLAPEVDLAATLERWGVRSIGDFARLPAAEIVSRLGEVGGALHRAARGLDPHPLLPRLPPPDFQEGLELEWPLATIEPFLFLARAALDRLCQRLATHGLGCARLDLALALEPAGHDERSVALPAPTREAKTLLAVTRLALEERPPGAAVAGFRFTAHPDRPRAAQLGLFGPDTPSPDRIATTLARLFALLGRDRVGAPRVDDGHRPERAVLVPYEPSPPPALSPALPERAHGLLAVRVLRPAIEIEVLGAEPADAADPSAAADAANAAPRELRSLAGEGADRRPRLDGAVRVASGPWRVEEAWWSDAPVTREYWDVELADRGLYRIFRDAATGRWYADGIYD
ncbi:MAG: DNA polymerase Y family protein [Thermoanaerobaculia bacterium]